MCKDAPVPKGKRALRRRRVPPRQAQRSGQSKSARNGVEASHALEHRRRDGHFL